MNSELEPVESPAPAPAEQVGGCVWMIIWMSAVTLLSGAMLIGGLLLGRSGGYAAIFALIAVGLGVSGAVIATGLAIADRIVRRTRPSWRPLAGLLSLAIGLALVAPGVATVLYRAPIPFDTGLPTSAGATLVILALVLSSGAIERRGALTLALGWVVLYGAIGYRLWTEMDAAVVWMGPGIDDRVQVAFQATRSADYVVRFGAPSCGDGRVIAAGRYEFVPDLDRGTLGKPAWVDLPADVLPLQPGDLVRVCLRDGLAAATAAGEFGGGAGGPSSFWPRD
jgi:hypothetical protein